VKKENWKIGSIQLKRPAVKTIILSVICLLIVAFAYLGSSVSENSICSYHEESLLIGPRQQADGIAQTFEANTKNLAGIVLYTDPGQNQNLTGQIHLEVTDGSDTIASADIPLEDFSEKEQVRVSLPEVHLELGKRYTVSLRLSGAADETVLALEYNENYAGMTLYKDGVAQRAVSGEESETGSTGALGMNLLYRHASNAAFLAKVVIIFGAIAAIAALLLGRPLVDGIALSTGAVFVLLYLSGIFGFLLQGVFFIQIAGCILFVCIPYLVQMKGIRLRDFITPGVVFYLLVLAAYFLLDRNMYTGKVDDLNQWQTCVRDMWYSNQYPFHEGSFLAFPRYTPGMGTLEYFILYLYGAFREGIILFACHSIGFAYLSILYSGISWKEWHKCIPASAMVIAFPLLIYQSHFGILYVDAYLGIVAGYLFVLYFTSKHSEYKTAGILLGSFFLSMIKEIGFAMAGIFFICVLLNLWHHDAKKKWKTLWKLPQTRQYFACAVMTILFFASWEGYCSFKGGTSAISLIREAAEISVNNADAAQQKVLIAYNGDLPAGAGVALSTASLSDDGILRNADGSAVVTPMIVLRAMAQFMLLDQVYFDCSYVGILALISVLCLLLYWSGLFHKLHLRMRAVLLCGILGSILYTAVMMACYMFLFRESSPIPAARRYMGTYLLTFLVAVVGSAAVSANNTVRMHWRQEISWLLGIAVILSVPKDHSYIGGEASIGMYAPTWEGHQSIGEVFRSFADKDEKIFYISYEDSDLVPQYDYLVFFNAVAPNLTQGLQGGWKPVESGSDLRGEGYRLVTTCEDYGDLLSSEYSYVYIQTAGSYFREHYGSLFREESEIKDGGIYRVSSENGRTTLIPIAYYPIR
jgi:hypothetical protein